MAVGDDAVELALAQGAYAQNCRSLRSIRPVRRLDQMVIDDHRVAGVSLEDAPVLLVALPATEEPGNQTSGDQTKQDIGPSPTELLKDTGHHRTNPQSRRR